MACENCNGSSVSNCTNCSGCNECNPCDPNPCGCKFIVDPKCIQWGGADFCAIQVSQGGSLEDILLWVDNFICNLSDFAVLNKNVGTGVGIYGGTDTDYYEKFRSLVNSDSVTVTEPDGDTIGFEVNTTWLASAISLASIGTGAEVYKGLNGTDHEFRSIISNTLDVTQNADTIQIELNSFDDLPRYIVNSAYTGTEELGTLAKPFKTIQAALDEFVGAGTADAPDNAGATIVVQKGSGYTFTGNLSYRNLTVVVEEDTDITHNPAAGSWFVDFDALDNTAAEFTLEVRKGARVLLTQKGFRNQGSTGGTKTIKLSGNGTVELSGTLAAGFVMFDVNSANAAGYDMPNQQNIYVEDVAIRSTEKDIWNVGRDGDLYFKDGSIRHASVGAAINVNSESFDQTGGTIDLDNVDLYINGASRVNGFTLTKDPAYSCTLTLNACRLYFPQGIDNLFVNKGATDEPTLNVQYFVVTESPTITEIFDSPILWENVNFRYNIIPFGNIDPTVVDLTKGNTVSVSNIVNGDNIDSLQSFPDRTTAAASLLVGAKFINTNGGDAVTANHFLDIVIP